MPAQNEDTSCCHRSKFPVDVLDSRNANLLLNEYEYPGIYSQLEFIDSSFCHNDAGAGSTKLEETSALRPLSVP
jgi:hypothetical protein